MRIDIQYYPNEDFVPVDIIDLEDLVVESDDDDAYDEWVDNQLSSGEEI